MEKKKTIIKIVICSIFILTIIIISALYVTNSNFRLSVDRFLNKEVSENNLKTIEISSEDNPVVHAYDKYIVVLTKGVLKSYDKTGNTVSSIDVNITSPMMDSNEKYLVIGEKRRKKILCYTRK